MRADRPLLAGVLFLAGGLATILSWSNGATTFTATFPFTGSALHVDVLTNGPGAVGGVVLIGIGLLLLSWAVLVAVFGQVMLLFNRDRDDPESLLDRESLLE